MECERWKIAEIDKLEKREHERISREQVNTGGEGRMMGETPGTIIVLSPCSNRGYRLCRSIARRFTGHFTVTPFRSQTRPVSMSSNRPTCYPLDRRLIAELLTGIYLAAGCVVFHRRPRGWSSHLCLRAVKKWVTLCRDIPRVNGQIARPKRDFIYRQIRRQ